MAGTNPIPCIPNLIFFFVFFVLLYFIAFFFIFSKWNPKLRSEASSCFISLIHGTPAVFLSLSAIFSDPSIDFNSPNTNYQNLIFDYSISYFLIDLSHYLIFNRNDFLFIIHHLAALFVLMTCRYLVFHGAYGISVMLILAEITNFCQNTLTLAGARRSDVEFADKVYQLMSPFYYALYTMIRCSVAPYFVYQMIVFYLSGVGNDDVIPKWLWVSWISVCALGICIGLHWISYLWIDLYKERTSIIVKKLD